MTKKKSKVKIIALVRKTIGGMHGWYEAMIDKTKVLIRKPLKND